MTLIHVLDHILFSIYMGPQASGQPVTSLIASSTTQAMSTHVLIQTPFFCAGIYSLPKSLNSS